MNKRMLFSAAAMLLFIYGGACMKAAQNEPQKGLTQEYLNKIAAEARIKFNMPALAITVADSSGIRLQEVQGTRTWNSENLVQKSDLFHIGSCSKLVLSTIAGKLVDEGRLTWQTKFFEIYPELKSSALPDYHEMTIEDLFLCEAGIKAYTSGEESFPQIDLSDPQRQDKFIRYLIALNPSSKRRSDGKFEHLYSNASYMMASAMLERISGMSYRQMTDNFLVNEMKLNLYIGWPNRHRTNQPWGHIVRGSKVEAQSPDNPYRIPELITPAGDLSLCPADYAKFIQSHLQALRGETSCISAQSADHIHFGREGFSLGTGNGVLENKKFSMMDGSGGTFYCRAIIVPADDFALTIMTNAAHEKLPEPAVDWLTMKIIKKHYGWEWKFWL